MSTGYLILYYKNSLIELYIHNFLMKKYISLNNVIDSNKLTSKIKYYHRKYFCFINKENHTVRCIIKLINITNYQIDIKIKSQQELALNELKKNDIFKSESAMLENFFNLDNNSDLNYINNKINLIIQEPNNIYEFNCILLEDSIDMGIFEKIKKCMKDKENSHNNEIQHNLRNNPILSNILSYQAVFRKKNSENQIGNNTVTNMRIGDISKNEKKEENFFDMKYNKYFLYDELLMDKNENKENKLFNKDKIINYIDLNNKFKPIFKISNNIFSKPFSDLDDIKDEIINVVDEKKFNGNNMIELNTNKVSSDNIISQTKKAEIKGNNENINNQGSTKNNSYRPLNNNINNISVVKDENQINDRYKRHDSYNNFTNLYLKKEVSNNSFISYDNNNNYYSNNNGSYKYHNRGDMNSLNNINSGETNKYEKFESRNSQLRNSYNNNRRNDSYDKRSNDSMKNYSNNNYSYHSSNNSSFNSERGRNYQRSRDRSPIQSSNNNRYSRDNRVDSPRQKPYDKYSDRNNLNKNNNYYGDNNNINYYYNINNYYRPGNTNRWNDGNFYQRGGNFQRNKNDYKNDYYNSNSYYTSHEGHYIRQRRRGNQNGGY